MIIHHESVPTHMAFRVKSTCQQTRLTLPQDSVPDETLLTVHSTCEIRVSIWHLMNTISNQRKTELSIYCQSEPKWTFKNLIRGACNGVFKETFLTYLGLKVKVVPVIASRASPVSIFELDPVFLGLVLAEFEVAFWEALGAAGAQKEAVSAGHADAFLATFFAISNNSITQITVSSQEIPCKTIIFTTLAIIIIIPHILPRSVKITYILSNLFHTSCFRWIQNIIRIIITKRRNRDSHLWQLPRIILIYPFSLHRLRAKHFAPDDTVWALFAVKGSLVPQKGHFLAV